MIKVNLAISTGRSEPVEVQQPELFQRFHENMFWNISNATRIYILIN